MNVEQALRALAADDVETTVPAHVDAAVMAQWDAARTTEQRNSVEPRSSAQPMRKASPAWRAALASVVAAVCAVTLLFVATMMRTPALDERQNAVSMPDSRAAVASTVAPLVAGPKAVPSPERVETRLVRPRSNMSPAIEAGYVLVPDAGAMRSPLTLMRVRMPRTAIARLGVPIVNPEAEGTVDVELLVGEDGVARSIRRVATVEWPAND